MGIVNGEDFQIVYSDTPGIIRNPAYKMHDFMNNYIESALTDADIILLMTEQGQPFEEEGIIDKLKQSTVPVLVLINKIDLSDQEKVVGEIEKWGRLLPGEEIVPISALNAFNIPKVFDLIIDKLPESPPYFPKDELTDRSVRFFVSEIIREKILKNYKKEIPYSVEVAVDSYKEEPKIDRIAATIFISRNTQKGIILGHHGQAIKRVGTQARKDIEEFVEKKVFLELTVKVNKEWRNNENILKRFGYDH